MAENKNMIFYNAMISKDPRFDGRFFAAVKTTGIYCRSICPAPKPKFENVTFFNTSAAAENKGFRPCLRCRPETSPDSPIWLGSSTSVNRALKFIETGYLNNNSVENLANILGMGGSYLRKLFKKNLGASPNQIHNTKRLDFARKLIDETTLAIIDIAYSSGFSSLRRFNDAFLKRFNKAPTKIRKDKSLEKSKLEFPNTTLTLPFRPPFDWEGTLNYLKIRSIPGVESVDRNSYSRSFYLNNKIGFVNITKSIKKNSLEVHIYFDDSRELLKITSKIKEMFDLNSDPLQISTFFENRLILDKTFKKNPGLRIPGCFDTNELAIRTIIGQQISLKSAVTILNRIVSRYGQKINNSPIENIQYCFPTIKELENMDFSNIGLTNKRAQTLIDFCKCINHKGLDLNNEFDIDKVSKKLLEIKGIGKWTVEYLKMRGLRDPNAFPDSDLVLYKAVKHYFPEIKGKVVPEKITINWQPWRSYAAMALWKHWGEINE